MRRLTVIGSCTSAAPPMVPSTGGSRDCAHRPQDFSARNRTTIFPGSAAFAIKDPVLVRGEDLRIFATLHPLTEGDENADQMVSVDACSGEPVMVPEPGASLPGLRAPGPGSPRPPAGANLARRSEGG